jgi:hypothetical protein
MINDLMLVSKLTVMGGEERNFTTKEIILIFPL